ncbi:Eco57I restriction-modification methylase domain-containing protein [Pedobacter suwonensis]|uniref:Eco57I restriction-modification methylase domain-containing protein n=1 Tax=Pedobacter suwonensis TaxID=332999 RepID=UPI0011A5226F|nr:N-6 DNA methylase [Pedobacter suwonensis]
MPLDALIKKLNLYGKEGLFFLSDSSWRSASNLSKRIAQSLSELCPDAFFSINDEPLILFFDNPLDSLTIERQCWNFNQAPVVFIIEDDNVRILNGFSYLKNVGLNVLSTDPTDFEYFKLITGESWENYKHQFDNRNRVDSKLLKNIDSARSLLIDNFNLPAKTANFLIGRIIFIRYLIDREVELKKYGILSKDDFYQILVSKQKAYTFFNNLQKDFNGNLFPLKYKIEDVDVNESDTVSEQHLNVIVDLLKGNIIGNEQISLFDVYNFSIIPIEFVSNVYEKFIGKSEQAKHGAYYTPLFLVDYIQKDTVTKYFDKNHLEFNCKVLDPACGSGIFLVETLRQIVYQYQKNNPEYSLEHNTEGYKKALKKLLTDNIYGIDKDENAISVAIFSLYITLLDYLKPSSIVNFQFPFLLGNNFFVNDFFDLSADYNNILNAHHFQFILGNPPWASKHPVGKQLFEIYWEAKEKKEKSVIKLSNREIAQAFLLRVSDFKYSECALIITSKILYNIKAITFRSYFLNNFTIRKLLELSSVRKHVFDKSNDSAVAPASIIFFKNTEEKSNNKTNIITHISLKPNLYFEVFKLLVIEKYDYKEVQQSFFIDNDWLWKVLVYGNVLDFHFIKRLKDHDSINDYLSDDTKFIYGKGICVNGGDENTIIEHKKINSSIDSKKRGLAPYHINYTKNFLSNLNFVHRPRQLALYQAPTLLVGKGITKEFKAKAAISDRDVIFTDAITSIKSLEGDLSFLKFLLALFNSDLFSYYLIQTNSSVGIEREQTHDKEDKFSMPIVYNGIDSHLIKLTDDITAATMTYYQKDFHDFERQELAELITSLNKQVTRELFKIYGLTKQELSLISYTIDFVIPALNDFSPAKFKGAVDRLFLAKYARVFIEHFNNIYYKDDNYFEIEIFLSQYAIGIYCKVIPQPSIFESQINWVKTDFNRLLTIFTTLSFSTLSQDLFMQKDIKGFEKDGFYIIKPNQYKCWHEALAYQDLSEIIEAIHQTQSDYE